MATTRDSQFDQIYYYEAYKQRLNDRRTMLKVFAAGSVIAAIAVSPLWLIATGFLLLMIAFQNSMYGGLHDYSHQAYPLACEFMKAVREKGFERKGLPYACVPRMLQLALAEHIVRQEEMRRLGRPGTEAVEPTDAVLIALNTTATCPNCGTTIEGDLLRRWWQATADYKPFPDATQRISAEDTCAKCGAPEANFQSHLP